MPTFHTGWPIISNARTSTPKNGILKMGPQLNDYRLVPCVLVLPRVLGRGHSNNTWHSRGGGGQQSVTSTFFADFKAS